MSAGTGIRPNLFTRLTSMDAGMAACWRRTFYPSLALFLMTAAFILTKTGRDALFFQHDGLFDLPKAYLGLALLAGPAATLTLGLMRWLGPRGARVAAPLLMAVVQVAFFLAVRPGGGWGMTLLWILIPLLYGVLLSLVWLLGADLLDLAPRFVLGRLYSTMGASSMMGGLAGAALARSLSSRLDPEVFFLAGAAGLVASALVCAVGHRSFPVAAVQPESDSAVPSPRGGALPGYPEIVALLRHPYLLLLAAVGMVAALVGVLIEFQFYWSAAGQGGSSRENLRIFADLYIALNTAAVVLQLIATPVLQRWFGVHGSLLILPAALLGASMVVAASASAFARAGLRVTEGGIKSSVHRSNWEQAYLPLERAQRPVAKLAVDGVAARMGEGAAAAILIWWLSSLMSRPHTHQQHAAWMSYLLLAGSTLWLMLAIALRRRRQAPGLAHHDAEELRSDLPIPDG